eukprot:4159015-Amphidinium_carterae.1
MDRPSPLASKWPFFPILLSFDALHSEEAQRCCVSLDMLLKQMRSRRAEKEQQRQLNMQLVKSPSDS